MSDKPNPSSSFDFLRNFWSGMDLTMPGMVRPPLTLEELDQRAAEMRVVEGWLKTNLNLVQMTIKGLEMQRSMLAAMQAMRDRVQEGQSAAAQEAARYAQEMQEQTADTAVPQDDEAPPTSEPREGAAKPEATGGEMPGGAANPFGHFSGLWPWAAPVDASPARGRQKSVSAKAPSQTSTRKTPSARARKSAPSGGTARKTASIPKAGVKTKSKKA